jgi:hypothetical protein
MRRQAPRAAKNPRFSAKYRSSVPSAFRRAMYADRRSARDFGFAVAYKTPATTRSARTAKQAAAMQ